MKISRNLKIAASMAMLALAPALQAKPANLAGEGQQAERGAQTGTQINVDKEAVRNVFLENAHYLREPASLPPGIADNLERGMTLPPGVAKRLEWELTQALPRHRGYDWRQVGKDAVLLQSATGLVEVVIKDVLN